MKRVPLALAVALALPSLAFAAKPPTHGQSQQSQSKAAPQVTYILKGVLTAYTPASSTAAGSVSLLVKSANRHGASLKGQTLTFAVAASTKVVVGSRTAPTVNDKGIVQVRGPKKIAATDSLATVLQTATARQVVDQGPAS